MEGLGLCSRIGEFACTLLGLPTLEVSWPTALLAGGHSQ